MIDSMIYALQTWNGSRRGLVAWDYALIGSLVTLAIVGGLQAYGGHMSSAWTNMIALI